MYLHIGNGVSIKKERIIGIFDLDTATVSSVTKKFINKSQARGEVEYTDTDLPRSFVLCEEKNKKYKVRLSRISSSGLRMRADGEIAE
ncbi:MAG: DUF370 domain-containing protein [Clostridia bacterium]|nr:DUF370 domain-containing protein [Clostridia bacterium]